MTPDDSIRELAKKTARSIVDHGSVPLATLKESIILQEKVDELLSKEIEFPEIPEYPTEITVNNLPEVQKVEITNLPEEKDDKEQVALLKEIAKELKKKEQYAYDIEIDPALKEQLRGDKGDGGIDGKDGQNGSPDTPEQIVDKLESLKGNDRLDVSAVKGIEEIINRIKETKIVSGGVRLLVNLFDVSISSPTDGQAIVYNATTQKWENGTISGSGAVDSVNGETGAVVLTTGDIAEDTDANYVSDAQLVVLGNTSGTNTGDNAVNSLYSGLVSNATHTGEVTGATSLTLDKTAITNKSTVTVAGADYVLISDTSDSGDLKKVLASDLIGGGGSGYTETFETVSANLSAYDYVIAYNGSGDVSTITYNLGGGLEVVKTLNYTSGDVTSIVLSGDTPSGISLTKTLTYTSGDVTGIAYT